MLHRWKVDVVAYGPSEHDTDSWFLMRGFPSPEARQKGEDAFYASDEWIKGPREAVLADIVSYATVIISIDQATLAGLRKTGRDEPRAENAMSTPSASDLTSLTQLNQDYIRSVQTSNVKRFGEILADDFLCSLPDGSLIDRAHFLAQTAKPVTISNLAAHDVNVRVMGDMAIVHARTTYNTADGKAAVRPLHGRLGTQKRPLARSLRSRHAQLSGVRSRITNRLRPCWHFPPTRRINVGLRCKARSQTQFS